MLKPKKKCHSIYNTFEKHEWAGKNFNESSILLGEFHKVYERELVQY